MLRSFLLLKIKQHWKVIISWSSELHIASDKNQVKYLLLLIQGKENMNYILVKTFYDESFQNMVDQWFQFISNEMLRVTDT